MDLSHGGRCFLLFPGFNHQQLGLVASGAERSHHCGAVVLSHHRVRHHQNFGARSDGLLLEALAQLLQ